MGVAQLFSGTREILVTLPALVHVPVFVILLVHSVNIHTYKDVAQGHDFSFWVLTRGG